MVLIEPIRMRRILDKLLHRHAAADMLPFVVIELPPSEHGIQVSLISGGAVQIEIRLKEGYLIAVRPVVGILPDGVILALRKLIQPVVLLEVALDHLNVFGFTHGSEINASVGDHS